ncbi:MFS transporter [Fictibacillus phosphorivorans]|uniref:MFS transporter n=1 Tax=Fictibacillus phosphorivorans TaxID=1221500 RepID=UPI00203ADE8C|nr:MFS transporter [Fictibacillus phosphorivorans]MCM3717625.1 sugar porter family MFS transporter [Fictibacillus phosphorivorans]MCM3775525.1 sugar porter family MFS transporter [Fictibacillus phosphorivorans]
MSSTDFSTFDDAKMTPLRKLAIWLVALGEFVDGYDLLVMGAALIMLTPEMGLTASQVGLLGAAAFVGAGIGLLIFGELTDRLGRKKVFVVTLISFIILSIASAFVMNFEQLLAVRLLIGIAVGADIVTSMAFLAEISPREKRGAFAGALPQIVWVLGAIVAQVLGGILYLNIGEGAWRWLFAFGAVPAALILLGRAYIPESPRWLLQQGRVKEARKALTKLGMSESIITSYQQRDHSQPTKKASYLDVFRKPYTRQALLGFIILTAAPLWGSVSSVTGTYVIKYVGNLGEVFSIFAGTFLWVGAMIGALLAYKYLDKIGRFNTVIFACSAGFVIAMILSTGIEKYPFWFLLTFYSLAIVDKFGACSFWVIPTELLPTHLRGRAQGISNAGARFMVAFTAYIVPVGIEKIGFSTTIQLLGFSGLLLAIYGITGRKYEPKGKSLEDASFDRIEDSGTDKIAVNK